MIEYLHEISDEKFEEINEKKKQDNINTSLFLQELAENDEHQKLNYSLLNLGILMQIISISLRIKEDEIESYLKIEKEDTRKRKMEIILKEINEKINLRYDFDKKTVVVSMLYTYNNLGYIFASKELFLRELAKKELDINGRFCEFACTYNVFKARFYN